mgnify:CR=1 FL=1
MPEEAPGDEQELGDYSDVSDYEVQRGWRVLVEPAHSSDDWESMKEGYEWSNKRRLAHIWQLPFGWETSSYHHKALDKETGELAQFFHYSRSRQIWAHSLPFDTYGVDGEWVIIEKE